MNYYKSLSRFLDQNQDRIIHFCLTSGGTCDLTKNLVDSSRKVGLNFVCFALDLKAATELKGRCDVVEYFDENVNESEFYLYGTESFKKVVYQRYLIGTELLREGKIIVYNDVDIVVKENYESDLLALFEQTGSECLIQFNGTNCCTGFYAMRLSERTKDLYSEQFLLENNFMEFSTDQHFFNEVVLNRGLISIEFLDRSFYPNGAFYYANAKQIDGVSKIIHFNCVLGREEKLRLMKQYGYWNEPTPVEVVSGLLNQGKVTEVLDACKKGIVQHGDLNCMKAFFEFLKIEEIFCKELGLFK